MELEILDACDLCGGTRIRPLDPEISVCECESCGFVFDNPRPSQREIARFYSRPKKYDSWLSEEHGRDLLWKRRLRKVRRIGKGGSLLDIGTGIGQFLHHAKPFYASVAGTEVSESAILIARERYSLDVIQGTIEAIEFADAKFDNITLFHVLEHVPSPRAVIDKCRSLLRSGGILVIAVPNELFSLKSRTKVLLKQVGVRRFSDCGKFALRQIKLDGSMQEIHVSHFTPEVMERLLAACGFSVLENSLDPYYVSTGARRMMAGVYYKLCHFIRMVTRYNIYDTIWMVARRI